MRRAAHEGRVVGGALLLCLVHQLPAPSHRLVQLIVRVLLEQLDLPGRRVDPAHDHVAFRELRAGGRDHRVTARVAQHRRFEAVNLDDVGAHLVGRRGVVRVQ